jgi:hypothetical protein
MFDKIEFEPSAYKHGISEEDSIWCIESERYRKLFEVYPCIKILYIGWSTTGFPLEVIGKEINEVFYVFHAMPLRKNWYYLINSKNIKRRYYGNR